MFNSTLKSSASQELFADGDHLISAGGKSYYRRPDISLSQRQQIAVDLLHREGEYGVVTPLSEMYRVSRTFMYDLRETARGALERALACGQPGRPPVGYCLEVDKNCVDRGIVTLATVGCCSIEQTQRLISEVLSVECSVGYISGVLQTAERRACEVNAGIVPQQGITVVADEIFDKQGPHLVVVEPHSLLILELSRQENRDSLTWGITLLDCAKRGVEIQTLVSDAAQGLKKGITLEKWY